MPPPQPRSLISDFSTHRVPKPYYERRLAQELEREKLDCRRDTHEEIRLPADDAGFHVGVAYLANIDSILVAEELGIVEAGIGVADTDRQARSGGIRQVVVDEVQVVRPEVVVP